MYRQKNYLCRCLLNIEKQMKEVFKEMKIPMGSSLFYVPENLKVNNTFSCELYVAYGIETKV